MLALAAALGGAFAVPAHAGGVVDVAWLPYERYSDPGRDPTDASRNEDVLSRHLQQLAARWLPDGQSLKVEVLEFDLAGDLRPSRRLSITDRRVARGGADTPQMVLRYVLSQGGAVVTSGEERVTDLAYLRHGADIVGDDPLRREKRMLEAWFKQRFVERKPAG